LEVGSVILGAQTSSGLIVPAKAGLVKETTAATRVIKVVDFMLIS
jgi:hypothetical protein